MSRKSIEAHVLSGRFPIMSDADFAALVVDIKANGLREPITLYKGQILDGRHRYRACVQLGVDPAFELFDGDDAAAEREVESLNLHRRHLTSKERSDLVRAELKRDPKQSDRSIAKKAHVGERAVVAARSELGAVATAPVRIGSDGVAQPVKRTRSDGRALAVAPGRRLADDRADEIRTLAAQGHNVDQIADNQGIKAQWAKRIMDKHGINVFVPKRGRPIQASRIVRETVSTVSGIAHGLSLAQGDIGIRKEEAAELLAELRPAIKAIRSLELKLKEIALNG